jgi:hypothetical protein
MEILYYSIFGCVSLIYPLIKALKMRMRLDVIVIIMLMVQWGLVPFFKNYAPATVVLLVGMFVLGRKGGVLWKKIDWTH